MARERGDCVGNMEREMGDCVWNIERGGCVLREFGEGLLCTEGFGEGWLCTEGIWKGWLCTEGIWRGWLCTEGMWRGVVELNLLKTITFTADSTHKVGFKKDLCDNEVLNIVLNCLFFPDTI